MVIQKRLSLIDADTASVDNSINSDFHYETNV